MKTNLNIITAFKKNADGAEYFTGTIDVAALRKLKQLEIEVVLMPAQQLPRPLDTIMARNGAADLIMFAATGASESAPKRKGQA
jgi:hypothetical protein